MFTARNAGKTGKLSVFPPKGLIGAVQATSVTYVPISG
jgi:hypothetical protein